VVRLGQRTCQEICERYEQDRPRGRGGRSKQADRSVTLMANPTPVGVSRKGGGRSRMFENAWLSSARGNVA
jgi:hypothetical protein